MKKVKLVTVIGTRPEIIRLARVMPTLDQSAAIDHIIIHTGQNYDYELNQIFFDDLGLRKPDYFLDAAGKTASTTIGNIIIKIDECLEHIQPDALLILGDTNSCLSAIPAKKRQIPIFHMEAGNRCFDQRVPEETNRKIVDHLADINLTYSHIAREYLLREGLPADRVIKTGSPMFEVLQFYKPKIDQSTVLKKLQLQQNEFIVVSVHREENLTHQRVSVLIHTLNKLAEQLGYAIIFSTHPRTQQLLNQLNLPTHTAIQFLKPLCFTDYIALQQNAFATLSDSGTISEEASILNFDALNLRDAHERPEAMEEAAVILTGINTEQILQGLAYLQQQKSKKKKHTITADYAVANVAEKIEKIILSYIHYVNKKVWNKKTTNDTHSISI